MRSTYYFLSFCVILIHGFSSEETTRVYNCLMSCADESCQDGCNYLTNDLDLYAQIDENAGANVTLHCTDATLMIIKYNPGIYIIEQSTSEDGWEIAKTRKGTFATFRNLTAGTLYRYRVHKVMKEGISKPEVSEWFTTYEVAYQPLSVSNISLLKTEVDDTNICQLRAEIAFEPAEDRSCNYNVLFWYGEHSLVNFDLKEVSDFHFKVNYLNYDQNYTVVISSNNGENTRMNNETSLTFVTPSCLEVQHNLNICAPQKVDGLQVEHSYKYGTLYDVNIHWDEPTHEPDSYTVQIDLLDEGDLHTITVTGNETKASFLNLELGSQYEVSIIAESTGGISLATSVIKNVTYKHATINKFYAELTIGVLILVAVVMVCLQYYRQKNKNFSMEYTHFESLNQKDPTIESIKKLDERCETEESNTLLNRDKFDLYPKMLELKGVLGSGAYGIVRLGSLQDESDNVTDVAVKMLKDNASVEDANNFHQEILIMKSAGKHPNIVSFIGYCSLYNKPVLVVEYCCKGDLQSYLRMIWQNMVNVAFDHRSRFKLDMESFTDSGIEHPSKNSDTKEVDYQNVRIIANRLYDIQQDIVQSTENVTEGDLLNFARQIVTGMEFLSSNRIVHRDLAARNVLVCADKVVKISDFGLSRDIYQENLYRKQGNGKLPLKWMAIEALTHQIYTTRSDVWSFGILLWEIVTMGAIPYPGISTDSMLKLLKSGYRMERPANCSAELYNIMVSCWNVRPQSRPSFTELKNSLDKLLSCYSENKYLNMSEILCNPEDQYHASTEN